MTFFDQIYTRLFPKKQTSITILHQEVIRRGKVYKQKYDQWKLSGGSGKIMSDLALAYEQKRMGQAGRLDVHLLATNYSNGFAISYDEAIGKQEFQYLFDRLAEKVEELDYKRRNADMALISREDLLETREKYYLKPNRNMSSADMEQYFGNILIEHIRINDKPSYIKLVANTYSDRAYKKAHNFEVLANHLLELA